MRIDAGPDRARDPFARSGFSTTCTPEVRAAIARNLRHPAGRPPNIVTTSCERLRTPSHHGTFAERRDELVDAESPAPRRSRAAARRSYALAPRRRAVGRSRQTRRISCAPVRVRLDQRRRQYQRSSSGTRRAMAEEVRVRVGQQRRAACRAPACGCARSVPPARRAAAFRPPRARPGSVPAGPTDRRSSSAASARSAARGAARRARNSYASATSRAIDSSSERRGLLAKALSRSLPPTVIVMSVGASLSASCGSCSPNTSPIVAPSVGEVLERDARDSARRDRRPAPRASARRRSVEQRRRAERRDGAGVRRALERDRDVGLARVERGIEVDRHRVAERDVRA